MTEQKLGRNNDFQPEELNQLSPQEILFVWQYFANIGGHDKDRMVTMLTFLSPFLIGTIGFAYINDNEVAAITGFLMSLIALAIVLMYGGYANRNWEQADRIAETYLVNSNLKGLDERGNVVVKPLSRELIPERFYDSGRIGRWVLKLAKFLSRSHNPNKSLAPIFQLFLVVSVITAVASLALWVDWVV